MRLGGWLPLRAPHARVTELRRCRAGAPTGRLVLIVVALVASSGCARRAQVPAATVDAGTRGDVRPVYDGPGPPEQLAVGLCRALHELPASRRTDCCGGGPGASMIGECVRVLSAALRAGALRLEAPDVAACEQAMTALHAGCDWVGPLPPPMPAACVHARGTRAAGVACRSSLECRPGLGCRGLGATQPGTCQPPAGPGAACAMATDVLAAYVLQSQIVDVEHPECAGHCLRHRCEPFVPLGGACASSRACGPGRRCAGGTCVEGAIGAPGEPCAGGDCGPDGRCVGGRCVLPARRGAACASDFDCAAACLRGDAGATCGPRC